MAAKYELNDASVVVVVGSGAGGGTLANELCQKGDKVVCLEAGNHLTLEDRAGLGFLDKGLSG